MLQRPKICLPIVGNLRDEITETARKMKDLPVQMVEWRMDFFAGYEREIPDLACELKKILGDKELICTLRTQAEGGQANGGRFDYHKLVLDLLAKGDADYIDVELERAPEELHEGKAERKAKLIGSYHNFQETETEEEIYKRLKKAMDLGMDVGKCAYMPKTLEDVNRLLDATGRMKEDFPDFPLITMSMGELGQMSRLYGGLYGSLVSFASYDQESAPGQVDYREMVSCFDKIYKGNKHICLVGFMGVGKSTISLTLKEMTGREEIDTDAWIEEAEGKTISQIFKDQGEEHFRQLETAMIDDLADLPPAIVSCGGGMALREINRRKLKAMGQVVWLEAEPETIYERVKDSDNRPILQGNMNVEFIRSLMDKRLPFYKKAATVRVKTDGRELEEIAKEILEKTS
ncbi:MAG: type I 3-dehydroquinate dehydratase [Eubacterium sp.]|nr:type I 3-dehydroquinate dehydratase [Eubacterium sp.]